MAHTSRRQLPGCMSQLSVREAQTCQRTAGPRHRACDGFSSLVRYSSMAAGEIEALQQECFEADFRLNGPSILRSVEVRFQGWKRYHDSS